MYHFGNSSKERLATCHADLQAICNDLITRVDCTITCGHRTEADQEAAVIACNSKTHWPESKHNGTPSLAVDIAPYPIDWNDSGRFYVFSGRFLDTAKRLLQEGKITHEVRWGGDWDKDGSTKDQSFNDLLHFELIALG